LAGRHVEDEDAVVPRIGDEEPLVRSVVLDGEGKLDGRRGAARVDLARPEVFLP
jgi:hypothetical protein